MKVINFGSLNIDYVYKLNHIVKPGETISSMKMRKHAGGKGLNQSLAIARAGGEVVHAGFYGIGGEFLFEILKKDGVDVSYLEKKDELNGHAIIQVEKTGENAIVLYEGTNGKINKKYIDKVLDNVVGNEYILFQNEISEISYAMREAKKKGCSIVLNPAPMNQKVFEYPMELVDILIVNKTEGQMLAGKEKEEQILDYFVLKYPKTKVILTLGDKGAWFMKGIKRFHVKAKKIKRIIDTTAAGDTFIGYYLTFLGKGYNDKQALEIAAKASSICIGIEGASSSIPRYTKVL